MPDHVLKTLRRSIFILSKRDESNLLSYWAGYFDGRSEERQQIVTLIGKYLNKEYGIEYKISNWMEQIDHYSFLKNVDWFNGFYQLLAEIDNYDGDLSDVRREFYLPQFSILDAPEETLKEVITNDGIILKVGDILTLSDKIGKDYERTKFYDGNIRNPSWELFYPSQKDFKFIRFFQKGIPKENLESMTYGNVWRIFSDFSTRIHAIERRNGKIFIYTEIFEIELEGALTQKEFSASPELTISASDQSMMGALNERIENYRLGLITLEESDMSIFIFQSFYFFKMKWHNYQKYFRSNLVREWSMIKNS